MKNETEKSKKKVKNESNGISEELKNTETERTEPKNVVYLNEQDTKYQEKFGKRRKKKWEKILLCIHAVDAFPMFLHDLNFIFIFFVLNITHSSFGMAKLFQMIDNGWMNFTTMRT